MHSKLSRRHDNTGHYIRCMVVSELLTLSLCLLCAWVGVIIIIIMEICKAPTLRLKAVNKHNTHNVLWDGKCYQQFTHNVDIKKGSSITVCKMHSHACMHTRMHACTHANPHIYRVVSSCSALLPSGISATKLLCKAWLPKPYTMLNIVLRTAWNTWGKTVLTDCCYFKYQKPSLCIFI